MPVPAGAVRSARGATPAGRSPRVSSATSPSRPRSASASSTSSRSPTTRRASVAATAAYGVLIGVFGYVFCVGLAGSCRGGSRARVSRPGSPRTAVYFVGGVVGWLLASRLGLALGLVHFSIGFAESARLLPGRGRDRRPRGHSLLRLRSHAEPAREVRRAPQGGRVRGEGDRARALDPAAHPSAAGALGRRLPHLGAKPPGAVRRGRLLRRLPAPGRRGRARRRGRRGQGHGGEPHHGHRQGGAAVPRGRALGRRGAAGSQPEAEAPPRRARVRGADLRAVRPEDGRLGARQRRPAGPVRSRRAAGVRARSRRRGRAFRSASASEVAYEKVGGTLAPGERLLLLSDGLPEAPTAQGEPLGYERFEALLAGARDVDALLESVRAATGPVLADDWTVLVLERTP